MQGLLARFAATLVGAAITSATAADISVLPDNLRPLRVGPVRTALPFSWTGCHLGLHLGWGFVENTVSGPFVDSAVPSTFGAPTSVVLNDSPIELKTNGVLGGGQVGCDFQFSPDWLIGVDADASGANISGGIRQTQSIGLIGPVIPAITTVNSSGTFSEKTDFIATATARVGYVFLAHGVIYGKGGAAWAKSSYNFGGKVSTDSCDIFQIAPPQCILMNPTVVTPFNFTGSDSRQGWTAGGGLEWAVVRDWSVKLEYDYLDFGTRTLAFTEPSFGAGTISIRQRIQEVKFGINYLFGG